jgi:hypothetical protein
MGSWSFENRSDIADVDRAYRALVEQALHEHGHDGYNGTISTTGGYRVVGRDPVPEARAEEIVRSRIEHLHKWDACEVIAVGDDAKVPTRTFRVRVKEADQAEAAARAQLKPGETLGAFALVEDRRRFKVRVRRGAGRRTVKYYQADPTGRAASGEGFPTLAAAVKALRAGAARRVEDDRQRAAAAKAEGREFHRFLSPAATPIIGVVSADGPLAVVETVAAGGDLVYLVTAKGPYPARLPFKYWLFYGMAAS